MERLPEHLHQLVTDNLGLVRKIARQMSRSLRDPALDYDDVYSSGCIGLMYAAQRYDASTGLAFSTYAYPSIWGFAANALNRVAPLRAPNHIRFLANRIRKYSLQDDDSAELAARFSKTIEAVENAKLYLSTKTVPGTVIVDGKQQVVADAYVSIPFDATEAQVREFLGYLAAQGKGGKRRTVLDLMLQGYTMQEAGAQLGVSKQAAHQLMIQVREDWAWYEHKRRMSCESTS